jgi:hypothetical protein
LVKHGCFHKTGAVDTGIRGSYLFGGDKGETKRDVLSRNTSQKKKKLIAKDKPG